MNAWIRTLWHDMLHPQSRIMRWIQRGIIGYLVITGVWSFIAACTGGDMIQLGVGYLLMVAVLALMYTMLVTRYRDSTTTAGRPRPTPAWVDALADRAGKAAERRPGLFLGLTAAATLAIDILGIVWIVRSWSSFDLVMQITLIIMAATLGLVALITIVRLAGTLVQLGRLVWKHRDELFRRPRP